MINKKVPYVREVLPNGLTVLAYPMEKLEAVGISLLVHAGRSYEVSGNALSHVAEHFCFSEGTKSFPSARAISEETELLGASHNATTRSRSVEVWLHLPRKNLERGLRLISEKVFSQAFVPGSEEKVRGAVLQEWKRRHDQPNFRFSKLMSDIRFGDPNHPYIRDESLDLIEHFIMDDVKNFYTKFFRPQQMVLGIGGRIEAGKAIDLVRKYFGGAAKSNFVAEPVFDSQTYGQKQIVTHEEKMGSAHLMVSFPGFGWKEHSREKRMAALMGTRILGGSIVSRLWRSLREDTGWVYQIDSSLSTFPYLGEMVIDTDCTVERLGDVMSTIQKEIVGFLDKGPTNREMDLERESRLGHLATGFEGSMGTARYFVWEEFDQEGIMLLEDEMKMVEGISVKDVVEMTKGLFDWSRVQVGLMNDFQQISKEKFTELANSTFASQ